MPKKNKDERYLDDDGYPTESLLYRIKNWDFRKDNVCYFLELIEKCWNYRESGFRRNGKKVIRLQLHTYGWSGNEEIIGAMQSNHIFWVMTWQKSTRGGHYWFRINLKQFQGDK